MIKIFQFFLLFKVRNVGQFLMFANILVFVSNFESNFSSAKQVQYHIKHKKKNN